MENQADQVKHPPKGIYLLPNLFTTAGLFAGFYSVVAAMQGSFEVAVHAIFIAMIMDGLDGRVARLTNTQSAFGIEYDSLSDVVSFGIAPALIVYSWSLYSLGKLGWLAAFLFTATAALRLARFNAQTGSSSDKRYFQGLPSPAGAAIIASMVWFGNEYSLNPESLAIVVAIITTVTGLLMVSNIRYYSFKELDFKGKVPFFVIILMLLLFIAISINPPTVLFTGFGIYGISGLVLTVNELRRRRRSRKHSTSHEQHDEE